MSSWKTCRNILCIRADNMGDVIMCGPAVRALKKFTQARITLLTSRLGSLITPHLPEIDETIIHDAAWIKSDTPATSMSTIMLIERLRQHQFDAAVIFTVYSQSALPAALTCLAAGIPLRLAYCRENPYDLLTNWVPDEEPYSKIVHQVRRDLSLVESIGANSEDDHLRLSISQGSKRCMLQKVEALAGSRTFFLLHPGVSEKKREYPAECWVELAQRLRQRFDVPVLISGSQKEKPLTSHIADEAGIGIFSAGGVFTIAEFAALIRQCIVLVTVNTSTVHIAAAMQTPQVVLYAQTNPQHTPWKSPNKVLPFKVKEGLKSRNEVVRYVSEYCMPPAKSFPYPGIVLSCVEELMAENQNTVKAEDGRQRI